MERKRILVVDDHRDVAESLAALLQLKGYRIFVEFDGPAAVATAARTRPDVALIDIGLRGTTGFEVCRQIRAEPWGRDMVILAVSGWTREQDRLEARAAGCNDFLLKPVLFETLERYLTCEFPSGMTACAGC